MTERASPPQPRKALSELAEWDWVYGAHDGYRVLHHPTKYNAATMEEQCAALATTSCGVRALWEIPGFLSRMDALRCDECCDRLGWPRGQGSPKNDNALRPLVEARLAAADD